MGVIVVSKCDVPNPEEKIHYPTIVVGGIERGHLGLSVGLVR